MHGLGNSDLIGTVASYKWSEAGMLLGSGVSPVVDLAIGVHAITLTVTDNDGATATDTVTITIAAAQSVTSFTLVNADTDQDIGPLNDGDVINLAGLPTPNLNVRADTVPNTVGSVVFGLDANSTFRTETSPPYALAGDSSGDYHPWTPSLGVHTLTATPFTDSNGGGTAPRSK